MREVQEIQETFSRKAGTGSLGNPAHRRGGTRERHRAEGRARGTELNAGNLAQGTPWKRVLRPKPSRDTSQNREPTAHTGSERGVDSQGRRAGGDTGRTGQGEGAEVDAGTDSGTGTVTGTRTGVCGQILTQVRDRESTGARQYGSQKTREKWEERQEERRQFPVHAQGG